MTPHPQTPKTISTQQAPGHGYDVDDDGNGFASAWRATLRWCLRVRVLVFGVWRRVWWSCELEVWVGGVGVQGLVRKLYYFTRPLSTEHGHQAAQTQTRLESRARSAQNNKRKHTSTDNIEPAELPHNAITTAATVAVAAYGGRMLRTDERG